MTKIVLNLLVWISWIILDNVDSNEIGVVLQTDGSYIPKSTSDTAIKINGRKFELYCRYVAKPCADIRKKIDIYIRRKN